MRSKVRAYSHQGHGPRADQQAGYISATSDSTPSLANGSRSIHLGRKRMLPTGRLCTCWRSYSLRITIAASEPRPIGPGADTSGAVGSRLERIGRRSGGPRRCVRPLASSPGRTSGRGLPSGWLVAFAPIISVGSEEARSIALALASVRRSNWACSFPAPSFHEDAAR